MSQRPYTRLTRTAVEVVEHLAQIWLRRHLRTVRDAVSGIWGSVHVQERPGQHIALGHRLRSASYCSAVEQASAEMSGGLLPAGFVPAQFYSALAQAFGLRASAAAPPG